MNRPWRLFVTAAGILCGCATLAVASDDASPPLYVWHNGQRVPTVIIPPRAGTPPTWQPATVEEVEAAAEAEDDRTADNLSDGDPPATDRASSSARRPPRRPARRSVIGYYHGYPVSIPRDPDNGWRYAPWLPPGYRDALEDAYWAGRYDERYDRERRFNRRDMQRRQARVLASHDKALHLGLEHLKAGDYAQAVVTLEMAAQLNHGDPACRIHLAQARLAQRHYDEAAQALRRALQLQPKLVYVTLNLASYYPEPREFDEHVQRLATHLRDQRGGGDTWFLLGYMEFQRNNLPAAYDAFRQAARTLPKDSLVTTYLRITKSPGP